MNAFKQKENNMFNSKQYGLLGAIAGASVLLSGLTASVTTNIVNQGISGATGPQGATGQTGPAGSAGATGATGPVGPAGSTGATGSQGPAGEAGANGTNGIDGREVEFSTEGNKLRWRYVGETEWRVLDLDFGGSSGFISTGGGSNEFTHWIFSENSYSVPNNLVSLTDILTSARAAYATSLINHPTTPYTAVNSLQDLVNIGTDNTTLKGRYVLTNNIDLSSRDLTTLPFNVVDGTFQGIFDGAGYELQNFSIDQVTDTNSGNASEIGIFKQLGNATVRNLTIKNTNYLITRSNYSSILGGVLAGRLIDNKKLVLESIKVENTTLTTTTAISYFGGVVGYSDDRSYISINNLTVDNFDINTDQNARYLGGFIGYTSGQSSIQGMDFSFELSVNKEIPSSTASREIQYVGAFAGYTRYESNIILNRGNVSLSGEFSYYSGGLVGQAEYETNIYLKEITSEVAISVSESNNPFSENYFGGLFGLIYDVSIVLFNDVTTLGTINGFNTLGGLVGVLYEDTLVRIENSVNHVDITGRSSIGGFIGAIDDDGGVKIFINESENYGNFTSKQIANYSYTELYYVGGFIGEVEDSDTSNQSYWNQIWIENSISVSEIDVETTNDNLITKSIDFWGFGGAIGYIDEYNFIRVSNSTFDTTIDVEYLNKIYTNSFYNYFGGIGGVIGSIDDDIVIQFINNDASVEINYTFSENSYAKFDNSNPPQPLTPSSYYVRFQIYSVGGAVGYVGSTVLFVDVASDYSLTIDYTIKNNDVSLLDIDSDLYNIGGYIGYFENGSVLFMDSGYTNFSFDYDVSGNYVSLDSNQDPYAADFDFEFYSVGEFMGYFGGFGIVQNLDYDATITLTLQAEAAGITVSTYQFGVGSFTGTPLPFIVSQENN
jgi:hypothetical protein